MHRLRERWVALLGGALLVTLSVSVAVGANPPDGTDGPRGQTIADFVHSLLFTQDEPALDDEGVEDEAEAVLTEDDADTDADAQVEAEVTGAEHGACVSEEATDKTDETGDENHGAVVSEAARDTCWEDEAELTEEPVVEADVTVESESNSHGKCVSEVAQDPDAIGGPNDNHGGAMSEAAHDTCWEE
jgi:hypothetical protein